MFIFGIFGIGSTNVRSEQLDMTVCPSCGKRGTIILNIFSRHFHFFWIPMFPIGRTGISQCLHCKNVLELKEMPDEFKEEFNSLLPISPIKLWQYSGLILLIVLFGQTIFYTIKMITQYF